jgi:hypothetical protein
MGSDINLQHHNNHFLLREIVIDAETTGLHPFSAERWAPAKGPQVVDVRKRDQFCRPVATLSPAGFGSSTREIVLDTETTTGAPSQFGFLAQDVRSVYPNLVTSGMRTPEAPDGLMRLDRIAMLAPIVKMLQELDARLSSLEANRAEGK